MTIDQQAEALQKKVREEYYKNGAEDQTILESIIDRLVGTEWEYRIDETMDGKYLFSITQYNPK